MRLRSLSLAVMATAGLLLAFTTASADKKSNPEFWKVWADRKATNLDKQQAVDALIGGKELKEEYLEILESDVWQYRDTMMFRLQTETNKELLAAMEEFLFDEKEVAKKPAAAEHVLWALYNNQNWSTPEKWVRASEIVKSKKTPEKVKARMLRELGVFRGETATAAENVEAQKLAKSNVRTLVGLLEWASLEKKFSRELRFLMGDALESLSSQDFGEDLAKWRFFADNLKDTEPLKPRTAAGFKDQFTDVEVEGHSFSSPTPRPVEMEILILPNLNTSDRYWYPYIFEINKTFKCTFVKLPDCSKMKDIEWMKRRDGTIDNSAYYYPLKQLVEVFEERRAQSKQKKIGLIAHGVSGWIALEYLRLHPESVAFAIIMGTWSGAGSFGNARNACEQSKDEAFKWFGTSLLYDPSGRTGQLAMTPEQNMWGTTGDYKRRWADPKALEPIFYSKKEWRIPPGSGARILVPQFELDQEMKGVGKVDVPVLFIHGAQDPMFWKKDEQDYRKCFSNMVWNVYENSANTPWAEEPVHFFDDFQSLLDKNDIIDKLKKEAEKDKEGK
ncbi:MAG: alpha/beta hydrolase [Planctomycetes bacterium]|nr:alpha/beta hydrolase [Planctomycetota bacterium]